MSSLADVPAKPLSLDIALGKNTKIPASNLQSAYRTGYRCCPCSNPCHQLRGAHAEGSAVASQCNVGDDQKAIRGACLVRHYSREQTKIPQQIQSTNMMFKASILTLFASQLASLAFGAPLEDSSAIQARAPASFKHPGVFLNIEQLKFIKSKVNSSAQPWTNAYKAMLSSSLGSTTRAANPRATVECG